MRIRDFCKAEWNRVQGRNNGSQDCHSLNPTPSPPESRDRGFPGAPGLQGNQCAQLDTSSIPLDDFSGVLRFAWDDCSYRGRARQPMGYLFLERFEDRTGGPAPSAVRGQRGRRPLSLVACSAAQLPWARAVPGLRGYPGIMGVSLSLFLLLPPLNPGFQVVKSKL
jgi:hypothetical protein